MYCKKCGHRTDEKTEDCPKCGTKYATAVETTAAEKPKVRWHVLATAVVVGIVLFVAVPRLFFRTDADLIEPTTKLRFLRALSHSEYRKIGQRDVRVEGQMLIMDWDLRWNVLEETKQQEILRLIGHAWQVVGGQNTQFRLEGEDAPVATYPSGQ